MQLEGVNDVAVLVASSPVEISKQTTSLYWRVASLFYHE